MSQPHSSRRTKKRPTSRSPPPAFTKKRRFTNDSYSGYSKEAPTTDGLMNSAGTLLSNSANGNKFSGSVENFQSNNVINCKQIISSDRYADLRSFLSPLDKEIESRHCTIREKLAKGTGGWLLQNQKFLKWKDGQDPQMLCLLGEPGTGKSSLLCHVIENLRSDEASCNSLVSFVYCDYQRRAQHTARTLIAALLWRILAYFEPEHDMVEELQKRCTRNHSLSTEAYTEYMCKAAGTGRFTSLWLCIDGVDELDPTERDALLHELQTISASPVFRLFLTGRSNAGVESSIRRIIGTAIRPVVTEYFSISTEDSSRDICNFLEQKLKEDPNPWLMNRGLRAIIFERLAGIRSTFLLAALNIKLVMAEGTIRERKETLDRLALNLENYYEEMIKRIEKRDKKYGLKILQWILLSIRPLTVQELRYAVAIRPEASDFCPEEDLPALSVLDSTLGLVTRDAWSGTVRFVHFTFKEHLCAHSSRYFPTGHALLARVTLTYMTFDAISFAQGRWRYLQGGDLFPFYPYARENWGYHARQNESRDVIENVCRLLENEKLSGIQALNNAATSPRWSSMAQGAFYSSAAHVVAYFGLSSTFAHILSRASQTRIDLHLYGKCGEALFLYAMHYSRIDIIKLLLKQRDFDVNGADWLGLTPFFRAVVGGCSQIVEQFLARRDLDVNVANRGQRPLIAATRMARNDIVLLLLGERGIDVNLTDTDGWTCLALAADRGWVNMVELLLQRNDIDANVVNAYGRTPLFLSTASQHTAVVMLLLEREDVNVNLADKDGQTPLLVATIQGQVDIVKKLLERNELNVSGEDGQTLLRAAVVGARGWEDIIRKLLERKEVPVNLPIKPGITALHAASRLSHIDIVTCLLGREDIDANVTDQDGWTPLLSAVYSGRVAIAELYLKRKDVNVNMVNRQGWSPLMSATMWGYLDIVKLLLERTDLDVNFADTNGRTPLIHAVDNTRTDIAKELLARNETSVNARDVEGWSPLLIAVDRGSIEIIDLLLARKDIDVNLAGADGWSPLLVAVDNGHIEIAERLLARRDINMTLTDDEHQAVLSSLEGGDNDTVNLLFQAKYKCTNGRDLRRFRNGSESLDD